MRKLQWTRSHPERSKTPRSGWDQSQWGIYLADLFARNPASPPLPGLHLQIADPIPYQCISEGAIGPEDWHWVTADHAPLLGALRGTVHSLSLSTYLSTRDSSRALRGAPAKWAGTSARFAGRIWDLNHRGISQRGRKVRHIWDLRWHGENRAVANPTQDDALHQCELCGHPQCGLAHIVCACPHLSHTRDGARSDLHTFVTRQPPTPAARVMQRYTQLLFEHPNLDQRGQLWLGHWTPTLRQALHPLLQPLTLREGQSALARIGRRVTEVFRDIWDSYVEAVENAQPPPSEPDLHLDPHPPSPLPSAPLCPVTHPLSPTATRLWDARLAADNG